MHYDVEFDMPEPTRLLVAGDWHGAGHYASQVIRHAKDSGCDAILHLGDWGYYPAWSEIGQHATGQCYFTQKMRELCKKVSIPLYWLDGNHENHEALTPGEGDEWVRHLPRGHRWQWWGKTWMSVGGGVSVNKHQLTPGRDYFPEETVTPVQFDYCLRPGEVDVIVAHDAPTGVDIPGVHIDLKNDTSYWPAEAIRASNNHRDVMALIAEDKLPDYWLHGHYHERYNNVWFPHTVHSAYPNLSRTISPEGGTLVVGLDCNRAPISHNVVILTKEDLWPG